MIIQRRAFLSGLGASLFAAPAIVRAASLMPVKVFKTEGWIIGGTRTGRWANLAKIINLKGFEKKLIYDLVNVSDEMLPQALDNIHKPGGFYIR